MVDICHSKTALWTGGVRSETILPTAVRILSKKSLKQIQHLPDRAPNSASLTLMGILPIEAVVHKNMLNLFWRWLTGEGI